MSFSFSFAGDDIDDEGCPPVTTTTAEPAGNSTTSSSAFPVAGKPLLPATSHSLKQMLSELPSKIAYSLLDVDLDGNGAIQLPRRELWDVRVQLMAEEGQDGDEAQPGLGSHDVRTGIYEGGFKSWESSIDLVKALFVSKSFLASDQQAPQVIELGCGTALPSLALFQWAMEARNGGDSLPLTITLADYNPSVLQLVTLPNFILSWALQQRSHSTLVNDAFSSEGDELDLSPEVLTSFEDFLSSQNITLRFLSGGWSPEFVSLVHSGSEAADGSAGRRRNAVLIGAETIYSPFALQAFAQTVMTLLNGAKSRGDNAEALVGAKKLYFGVGGSLDDFVDQARQQGAIVNSIREEVEGVRRGVVHCKLPE